MLKLAIISLALTACLDEATDPSATEATLGDSTKPEATSVSIERSRVAAAAHIDRDGKLAVDRDPKGNIDHEYAADVQSGRIAGTAQIEHDVKLAVDRDPKGDVGHEYASDACAMLPSDGACSLACDQDALFDRYIPKGACVEFLCDLSDGRVLRIGGCNW